MSEFSYFNNTRQISEPGSRPGLDVWQAAFEVKIYKSHRRIGAIGEVLKAIELREKHVQSVLTLLEPLASRMVP
jgi:hypothetical protein